MSLLQSAFFFVLTKVVSGVPFSDYRTKRTSSSSSLRSSVGCRFFIPILRADLPFPLPRISVQNPIAVRCFLPLNVF